MRASLTAGRNGLNRPGGESECGGLAGTESEDVDLDNAGLRFDPRAATDGGISIQHIGSGTKGGL